MVPIVPHVGTLEGTPFDVRERETPNDWRHIDSSSMRYSKVSSTLSGWETEAQQIPVLECQIIEMRQRTDIDVRGRTVRVVKYDERERQQAQLVMF